MEWIKRFFCKHEWEIMYNQSISIFEPHAGFDDRPVGRKIVIIQRCKKCGKIDKKVIEV